MEKSAQRRSFGDFLPWPSTCCERGGGTEGRVGLVEKKLTVSVDRKRELTDRGDCPISIRRQCELLGLNLSSLYYKPSRESEEYLQLMRLIDEQYMRTPFYGSRGMSAWLRTGKGMR